jgi:hypothetical protein
MSSVTKKEHVSPGHAITKLEKSSKHADGKKTKNGSFFRKAAKN